MKALIFDIGGVLIRTTDWSKRHAWERKLGLAHGTLEPLVHGTDLGKDYELGRLTYDGFWDAVARKLHIQAAELAQFRADFYEGDTLNPELITLIKAQRNAGRKTGIISNAPPATRFVITEQHKIAHLFDAIIISGEVGVRKPDVGIYTLACAELDVKPAESIFVDDLEVNIAGARAAGLHGVHFTSNETVLKAIDALLGSTPARATGRRPAR